ncbi:unnamed protein product [Peniophora sp. CBMAI 1063]|nr:unnamed protein product [Peniophora sp. CBMAI 1063]
MDSPSKPVEIPLGMEWCICQRLCNGGKLITERRYRDHLKAEVDVAAGSTLEKPGNATDTSSLRKRPRADTGGVSSASRAAPSRREDREDARWRITSAQQHDTLPYIDTEPVPRPNELPGRPSTSPARSPPRSPAPEAPAYTSNPDDEPPEEGKDGTGDEGEGEDDDHEGEDDDHEGEDDEDEDEERHSDEDDAEEQADVPPGGGPGDNSNITLPPEFAEPEADLDESDEAAGSAILECRWAQRLVSAMKNAGLDGSGLSEDVLYRLRNPSAEVSTISPGLRFSFATYFATNGANGSEDAYRKIRVAEQIRGGLPPGYEMLSFEKMEKQLEKISAVSPITRDMCINSCIAYAGPDFESRDDCPYCKESRWDADVLRSSRGKKKVARLQFDTIPLGPQLQARRGHPEIAKLMQHRALEVTKVQELAGGCTCLTVEEYGDVYVGSELLTRLLSGEIKATDSIVMFSIDGAQLRWSAALSQQGKIHVLPGCVVPGPNKPKNLDSFIYTGLYHLAALMNEGLHVWDAASGATYVDRPFLAYVTADTPAMAALNGMVGHLSRFSCRFYCAMPGRNKGSKPTYYPASLRPNNPSSAQSKHDDYKLKDLAKETTEKQRTRSVT